MLFIRDLCKKRDLHIKGYCEPFIGMGGAFMYALSVFGSDFVFYGGDICPSIICMWKAIQKGWLPAYENDTKEKYNELKKSVTPSPEKGFFCCFRSYKSIYLTGWIENGKSLLNARNRIRKVKKVIKEVVFSCSSYIQYSKLKNCIIYCDPPYEGYNYYYDEKSKTRAWSVTAFWKWCRMMSKNNLVVVSEYSGPADFHSVHIKDKEYLFYL